MSVPGLPPELAALLARLRQRGLPVMTVEIGRLQHLLAVPGSLEAGGLPALLAAVLLPQDGLGPAGQQQAEPGRGAPAGERGG
ncbi:hypothetical protein [uncultured Thiodictyon sp.]|uniref:hypothetical protein n=1 Tax=uncultured Thiodictyon sp. TaxID=1846217 RepID=UPI0025D169FF|nr:hypothetical protein [uncultured Thiodictyon sp.]